MVSKDDAALICEYGKNHGRLCRVLHEWDGMPVGTNRYSSLKDKQCFVVRSVGSPFVYDPPITEIFYSMTATYLIVVEAKHLKCVAKAHEINWKFWERA